MNAEPRKRSQGLTLLCYMLMIVYAVGAVFLFISWQGLEGVEPLAWRRETIPVYAFLALVGAGSAFAVLKGRRAGVYSLSLTWIATAAMNLIFVRPVPVSALLFSVLLAAAFFLLLRSAWKNMV